MIRFTTNGASIAADLATYLHLPNPASAEVGIMIDERKPAETVLDHIGEVLGCGGWHVTEGVSMDPPVLFAGTDPFAPTLCYLDGSGYVVGIPAVVIRWECALLAMCESRAALRVMRDREYAASWGEAFAGGLHDRMPHEAARIANWKAKKA